MSEYLDRKQVIELYEKHHSHLATYVWEFGQELRQLPIVEQRPQGEWIIRRNKQGAHIYSVCSKCNMAYLETDFPNFCPNCGADMREGDQK